LNALSGTSLEENCTLHFSAEIKGNKTVHLKICMVLVIYLALGFLINELGPFCFVEL